MGSYTFKSAAQRGFDVLFPLFTKATYDKRFWFAGNTFHTLLDYLLNAGLPDTDGAVVNAGYGLYKDLYNEQNWWRDDYGWWGDSLLLAITHRDALQLSAPRYDDLFANMTAAAAYCWQRMNNARSDTLYGRPADHAAGSGNIRGGVYNMPEWECGDTISKIMQGRNSCTNEGYWLLSLGMARHFSSPAYAQAAADMGIWAQQWLARTPVCNADNGLVGILDSACHVLERPMGHKEVPSWYWTGDQGLFSRGLAEANIQPARAAQIVNATIASLQDDEGVLHENMAFVAAGLRAYIFDYATGKGIFMRSLRAVNTNGAFTKFIVTNAQQVWCHRHTDTDPADLLTFNWDRKHGYEDIDLDEGTDFGRATQQAAGLDALNAALLVVPPDTPIDCDGDE